MPSKPPMKDELILGLLNLVYFLLEAGDLSTMNSNTGDQIELTMADIQERVDDWWHDHWKQESHKDAKKASEK